MKGDAMLEQLRVPPRSEDAEQAALGAMLLERDAIVRAEELLQPEDFYHDAHRWIYRVVLDLYRRNQPVDLITLGEWLRARASTGEANPDDNLLAQVGGTLYLTTLMESAPTAAGITWYAEIVREKAMRRRLIATADKITHEAYISPREANELLRDSEGKLFALVEQALSSGPLAMPDVFDIIRDAIARRGEGSGVGFTTDLERLNLLLTPIKPGEMVVVAGRPGMGKSALAMQMALAACEQHRRGIFFTLEMDVDSLAIRLLHAYGCTGPAENDPRLHPDHAEEADRKMAKLLKNMRDVKLRVVDAPALCANDIIHLGRRAKHDGGLDFIVVDYLQLMESNERQHSVYERIRAVSRELKMAAKTLNAAVIAVSQLSRQVESRNPPRPQMSDLRESGQLEQDADKIILLYRPGCYGDHALREANLPAGDKSSAELILAKQRNGPTGSVWTRFDEEKTWFGEW